MQMHHTEQKIAKYIFDNQLIQPEQTVIVALSGGKDSICLLHILLKLNFKVEAAHCNFNLRDVESDKEQAFVQKLCSDLAVPLHLISFDTKNEALSNESTQMTARRLRYNWFNDLAKNEKLIATAHSANDQAETIIYNFAKGCGLSGIRGMLPKNNQIIRPLLTISSTEIMAYNQHNNFKHTNDSSNFSTKYMRNRIRQNIIPELQQVNSNFINKINEHHQRFRELELGINYIADELKKLYFKKNNDQIFIDLEHLINNPAYLSILHNWLHEYGFNYAQISDICLANNGAKVHANEYTLLKDRTDLILNKSKIIDDNVYEIVGDYGSLTTKNHRKIIWENNITQPDIKMLKNPSHAYLNKDLLYFPLHIRTAKEGDYFVPFGMTGKQKLSDFFINLKLSQFEKEHTLVLLNNNEIVWVIGHRISNKYRIQANSKSIFHLAYKA